MAGRARLTVPPAQLRSTQELLEKKQRFFDALTVAISIAVEAAETDAIGLQLLEDALQPILLCDRETILKMVTIGRLFRLKGKQAT